MAGVYAFTGVEPCAHDVDNIGFATAEFDARLGTPGLRPQARRVGRQTILPPDLWQR